MEFTEEQEKYIESRIADATKDLFTKDELDRQVTAEVDRRVESGIRKGLETHKAKWEQEFEKKAQLSAEELAKLTVDEKLKAIESREAEINTRSNTIDAREMFVEAEIPEDDYVKFMDLLVSDDVDVTHSNVSNFIDSFKTTRENIEKSLKEKLSNVPAPKGEVDTPKSNGGLEDFVKIANEANIRGQ